MRKSEILNLTWDRVDLKTGVIRLCPEDTKTQEGRAISLTKELSETLKNATIYLYASGKPLPYVFTHAGRRIGAVRRPSRRRVGRLASPIWFFTTCGIRL